MAIVIPPFVQYQQQVIPLKGNWNRRPMGADGKDQGDMFVSLELDWTGSNPGNAISISMAGNSPVTLGQIVALVVDNSRCGSDVAFVFPDTGFELVVAAHTPGGIYPVFTNTTNFYAVASGAIATDITILQVCNSMPPPLAILPSTAQQRVAATGVSFAAGSTPIVAAGNNGTVQQLSIFGTVSSGGAAVSGSISIIDGSGATIWFGNINITQLNNSQMVQVDIPMSKRFVNGITCVVAGTLTGTFAVNIYYSVP